MISFPRAPRSLFLGLLIVFSGLPLMVVASGDPAAAAHPAVLFLWIAILLLAAKFSSFVELYRQPAVLGELLIGVALGNATLLGINWFSPIAQNDIIAFLAELGVVVLLFQIGLESNVEKMKSVGLRALLVAVVGVVVPFVLGTFVVSPYFFAESSFHTHLFIGAALTATSVGITARVFKDLGKLSMSEAQVVLGAAVIDDVFGLIILAVVSAIVMTGAITFMTVSIIIGKAVLFLVGALVLGQALAPRISRFFATISTGVGMKFTLVMCFGLLFAYIASVIGLAPIVGAFAAGLILDAVHFRYFKDPNVVEDVRAATAALPAAEKERVLQAIEPHAERHIEDIVEPVGYLLVPIFFVVTGMNVNVSTLFHPGILGVALAITVVAVLGKVCAGFVSGSSRPWLVGWGMVPRGEVGLIFATIGRSLGVVNDEVYSIIVVVVILTTLITPPLLGYLLRREESSTVAAVS